MEKPSAKTRRPPVIRRADLILAACVLAAALLLLAGGRLFARPGAAAVVTIPDGETVLPLDRPGTFSFSGKNGLTLIVEVADGRVRVKESGCPDQICVHSGWLTRSGQSAACVPAGVAVRVSADGAPVSGGVDAVTG